MYTAHLGLILLGDIFWAAVGPYDVFVSYSSALHTSLTRIQGFSLMVTKHNSTALKVNGMTEDIFICSSFWSKSFCIRSPDTKKKFF